MLYDDKYNYKIIDDYVFDEKYLTAKKDGSKNKKCILIYYKENNEIKCEKLPDETYLKNYNDIISTYELEEIASSCRGSDAGYTYKKYYKIKDKICFVKYELPKTREFIVGKNDNEKMKEFFEELKK